MLASWAPGTALSFQLTFGNGSSLHGSSKKTLIFFFKFLSQLVPFEAPQYLKVDAPSLLGGWASRFARAGYLRVN